MPGVEDVAANALSLGSGLTLASTGLGVVKGIADLFGAKSDEEKAREELERIKQPFYKIQNEYFQNRNISGNVATSGLTPEAKNYYTTQSEKGLGAGINYLTQAGGSPNDAAKIFDIYNDSIDKVAMQDAEQRIANINNFMNYNKEVAGQKTMKWALDEYQPYQRKLKEITERINAAKQNKNNAVNTTIGSLSAAGTALSNNDLMSKLFGNSGGSGVANYVAPATNQAITSESLRQPGATIKPLQSPQMANNYIQDISNLPG